MVLNIQVFSFLALKIVKSDFFVLVSPLSQNKPLSIFSLYNSLLIYTYGTITCYLLGDTFKTLGVIFMVQLLSKTIFLKKFMRGMLEAWDWLWR